MMGKISASDKMRIQTLRELSLGYRRIVSKFPDKQLNLQSSEVQPLSEKPGIIRKRGH